MNLLQQKIDSIEKRLSEIENKLQISTLPSLEPLPNTPKHLESQSASIAPPGKWLGIISVICFVLAAGFIVKLSIDSGWLTPMRQIGLAYLLGFVLIAMGYVFSKKDLVYASFLPAAGIIILYLSTFAAHEYYKLMAFEMALGITGLISLFCMGLFTLFKHDMYTIIAAVGAYVSPLLLDFGRPTPFSLYYLILCSLAFATLSIWVKSRMLTLISAYLAIVMTAIFGLSLRLDKWVTLALAAHFLIFSLGTYFYTAITKQSLTEDEAMSFLPILLIFYAVEYHFINRINLDMAPWISLGFAGILICLYLVAKEWFSEQSLNSQPMIISFVTVVCFHSIYLELLPSIVQPWLFVVIMLGFCLMTNKRLVENKKTFLVPLWALSAIVVIEYLSMMSHLLIGEYNKSWLQVALASFASIWAALAFQRRFLMRRETYHYILLGAAHFMGITAFYRLVEVYGSLAVSSSWLFYALAVIVFAFVRKDPVMAKSAVFVLGIAAGKALIYDAASAPNTVRILCLLLTGVVLYLSGFILRKISSWKK